MPFNANVDSPNLVQVPQSIYVPGRYPTTWLVQLVADFTDGWAGEIATNWTLTVRTILGVGRSNVEIFSAYQLANFGQLKDQGFIPADTLNVDAKLTAASAVTGGTKIFAVALMATPQLPIVERL